MNLHLFLMKDRRKFGWLISVILFFGTISAQTQYIILPNGERVFLNSDQPTFYSTIEENGQLKSFEMEDPDEMVRVIVRFKGEPLSVSGARDRLEKRRSLETEHSGFKQALDGLTQSLQRPSGMSYEYEITRKYFNVFNGVALRANRGLVNRMYSLPMVKSVHEDCEVKINLEKSVPQIRADRVQNELGLTGEGVLVGVIDTGIDYTHPALGGGIGQGFRVVGGWDFANGDADPMDGHGHGTHVAGIIGAKNDSLTGVAPDVSFLAVKVLSDNGRGWYSDIVAGIEYCLDPDGNAETDDGASILNMSFGGDPSEDSPLDIAVDNATGVGILSVVAAGNSGRDTPFHSPYETIGSPGTSKTALTVGAVDSSFRIAEFSSKGPDEIHYAIKPEIVAPGVEITSCFLNGKTTTWSGTSMATPHVAGVAALLKQQNPERTPGEIKAILINSARSAKEENKPYIYGNGSVDAWNATHLDFSVEPGVLSFDIVDLAHSVWHDTLSFTITNLSSDFRTIKLISNLDNSSNIGLTLSDNSIELMPNEDTEIVVFLVVPSTVPIISEEPFAYTGDILCISEDDTIHVPFGFIKSNLLVIEADLSIGSLYLWDPSSVYSERLDPTVQYGKKCITTVGEGTYNILAILWDDSSENRNHFVIERQSIHTSGLTFMHISSDEAAFQVFPGEICDEEGAPISESMTGSSIFENWIEFKLIIYRTEKIGYKNYRSRFSYGYISPDISLMNIYTSPIDTTIDAIEVIISGAGDAILALFNASQGISSQENLTIQSGPENISEFYVQTSFRTNSDQIQYGFLYLFDRILNPTTRWYHSHGLGIQEKSAYRLFLPKIFPTFNPRRYYAFSVGSIEYDDEKNIHVTQQSPDLIVGDDGLLRALEAISFRPNISDITPFAVYHPGDTLVVKPSCEMRVPSFKILNLGEDKGLIRIRASGRNAKRGFVSPAGNYELDDFENFLIKSKFQLFANNSIRHPVKEEYYPILDYIYEIQDHGHFRAWIESEPFELMGQSGRTLVDEEFDAPDTNLSVPCIDVLQVKGDGRLTKWIKPGQEGQVRLRVFDKDGDIDQVELALIPSSGEEIPLNPIATNDREFMAEIPNNLPHEFIDIHVKVKDKKGSQIEMTSCPAFFYGSSSDEIRFDSRISMYTYRLRNVQDVSIQPGDTLEYTITFQNSGNLPAEDIRIILPETDHLHPLGDNTIELEDLDVDQFGWDYCPLVLHKYIAGHVEYYPRIEWQSAGKSYSRNCKIVIVDPTPDDNPEVTVPTKGFKLYGNYPNPFNTKTNILYDLYEKTPVTLTIYDILGRRIKTFDKKSQYPGQHIIIWDGKSKSGTSSASGLYFYQLKTRMGVKTGKMVLFK